ncbi:hypothetical protein BDAP_002660 [Binucleata daphniae]
MDIDVYEIDKDVNEYRKILNELKIFMYKFSIGNYDENEKKRKIFELGSDELVKKIVDAENNNCLDIKSMGKMWECKLENLQKKKKGGLGSQPPSGDSWATLD